MSFKKAYSTLKYTYVFGKQDSKITFFFSLKINLDKILLAERAKHKLSIAAALSWGFLESTDLLVVRKCYETGCLYIFWGSIYRFITFSRILRTFKKKKKKPHVSRKPLNEHLVPSQNLAGQRWKIPLLVQGGTGGGDF